MKLVAVMGSPHGMKGNTGQVLDKVIEAAKTEGAEVKVFELEGMDIRPCRACDACHRTGDCQIDDDFRNVADALVQADGVILASPNYIFNVTAQMKTFMDRCSCHIHCQMMEGRYGAAVVTSGGGDCAEVEVYMLRFLRAMGYRAVGSVGLEAWRLAYEQARPEAMEAATKLGTELVQAIKEQREMPDEDAKRRPFYERMKALVKARKEDWRFEYDHWKSAGKS